MSIDGGLRHTGARCDLAGGDLVGASIGQQLGQRVEDLVARLAELFLAQRGVIRAVVNRQSSVDVNITRKSMHIQNTSLLTI